MFDKIQYKIAKRYLKKKGVNIRDVLGTAHFGETNELINLKNDISFIKDFIGRKYVNENYVYTFFIEGMPFYFQDSILSSSVKNIIIELEQKEYNFDNIQFSSDGKVLDIGGNIGIISIYLAKKYPFLKIYAFEPVRENYDNFIANIKLNNIPDGTIVVENKAITKDGRNVSMNLDFQNRGGCSVSDVFADNYNFDKNNIEVSSVTLEEVFRRYHIDKLDLLKIDCEGSEYEILYNADKELLGRINHIRGEFHENRSKTDEYDADKLLAYVKQFSGDVDVYINRYCLL